MKNYVLILLPIVVLTILSGCVEGPQKGERAKMLDTQPTETLKYSNEKIPEPPPDWIPPKT